MKALPSSCVAAAAIALSACATNTGQSSLGAETSAQEQGQGSGRTIILNGYEWENVDYVSWKCREFGSVFGGKVLVEVGYRLEDPVEPPEIDGELSAETQLRLYKIHQATKTLIEGSRGFILFDGTNAGEVAFYYRDGLNHRWDWPPSREDNSRTYSLIVTPDGNGLYYDFSSVEKGEGKKSDDVFKCRK